MFIKTQAIPLRIIPYSETSQIINWLTAEFGPITTIFKGAQRPKSPFIGQYDLFYTCELICYAKELQGMHIGKECTPIKLHSNLRDNWKSIVTLSYLCDFTLNVTFKNINTEEIYNLLSNTIDFVSKNGTKPQLIYWFEIKMLNILGVTPQLSKCAGCGITIKTNKSVGFSSKRGGILCEKCAIETRRNQQQTKQAHTHHAPFTIAPNITAILRNWQFSKTPHSAFNTKCTKELVAFNKILGIFIKDHLDINLKSRNISIDMLTE